tara:strand:+ start:8563 stop:8742 length:180 start_codon:yes stop_codon:yes gene_type:complete
MHHEAVSDEEMLRYGLLESDVFPSALSALLPLVGGRGVWRGRRGRRVWDARVLFRGFPI